MCKNSCKVACLDRDGTMNVEVNYLHRKEDLKLIDGTAEAVRLLKNEAGWGKTVNSGTVAALPFNQKAFQQELDKFSSSHISFLPEMIISFYFEQIQQTGESRPAHPLCILPLQNGRPG